MLYKFKNRLIYPCLFFILIFSLSTNAAKLVVNHKPLLKSKLSSVLSDSTEQHDLIHNLLLVNGLQKLTPDPNEELNLYSGSYKLNYLDYSVPVAPGLDMEVKRVYTSGIHTLDLYKNEYLNDNFLDSWQMGVAYLYEYKENSCTKEEGCFTVFITSDGISRNFYSYNDSETWGKSQDNWLFDAPNNTIYAPNGFTYKFNHIVNNRNNIKYYLTEIKTADGHWVKYHYDGKFITKITSSDPNKVIDININKTKHIWEQCDYVETNKGPMSVCRTVNFPVPDAVYFNGKKIIDYSYMVSTPLPYTVSLASVKKSNGEVWNYDYVAYYLKSPISGDGHHNFRVQLTKVQHPSGEITQYESEPEPHYQYSNGIYGIRLKSRSHSGVNKHIPAAKWEFRYGFEKDTNNINTKVVDVIGPLHSVRTVFSDSQDDYVWRQGYVLEQSVYSGRDFNNSSILQHDTYNWDKIYRTKDVYSLTRVTKIPAKDQATYTPRLKSQKTKIIYADGTDSYTTNYNGYDEYDNPIEINHVFNSTNGSQYNRTINQEYLNLELTDKQILGLTTKIGVNGKTLLQQEYDENGHLIKAIKLGKKTNYSYSDGLLSSVTDALNNIVSYSSYVGVIPGLVINADGTSIKKIINDDGSVASQTNANNHTTNYEYDSFGALLKEQPPLGTAWVYNYSYPGAGINKTTILDNYKITTNFNAMGSVNYSLDNNNKSIIYKYDALGRKRFQSYPSTKGTSDEGYYYSYDSLNRMRSNCSPKSGENCITYDYLSDNKQKITYPNGEYIIKTYRSYNSPAQKDLINIDEDERQTTIKRDVLGNVLSVKQGEMVKTYEYDSSYNLIKYTEPETGITQYEYDAVGNIVKKRRGNGSINYKYHPKNYNLLKTSYSDDSYNVTYDYDKNGNLIYLEKGNTVRNYEYNQVGNLISESLLVNTNKGKQTLETTYLYNNKNELTAQVYPDNTKISYNPNVYGQPTQVGDYLKNIQYHDNHTWKSLVFGNGKQAFTTLDDSGRINLYSYDNINLKYSYDSNNNLRNLILTSNLDYNYNLDFSYDKQGRIKTANGPWGDFSYKYDANDNIINVSDYKKNKHNIKFKYTNNKLYKISDSKSFSLNDYQYDSYGNVSSDNNGRYLYGLDGNLLTSLGSKTDYYEYDGNQHRVIKKNNNSEIITFYTKSGNPIYELNPKTGESTKYIYFNGYRIAKTTTSKDLSKPDTNYFYNDSIGSPIAMTDEQGNVSWQELYQPFGARVLSRNNIVNDNLNKYWFAGKEVDSSKLSYFGARFYSPNTGRFMSPDPVEVNPENTSSFNRYAYGNNNPYKYVDPDGRFAWVAILPIIFSIIDAAITANDTYNAYQEGGMAAAGGEFAFAMGVSRVPGGKLVSKYGKASKGGLNLFKWGHESMKNTQNFKKSGDYFLYLPNKGSPKANWKQNSGFLRQEMKKGNAIFDSYRDASGNLIRDNKNTFIEAERNLLKSRGWTYSKGTGAWHPPY